MRESDDIVGMTFSELAFVIAFILILLLVVGNQGAVELLAQLRDARAKLEQSEEALAEANLRAAALEKELEQRQSRQRPSCIERGVAPSFLFTGTIVGIGTYVVDGAQRSIANLRALYAEQLEVAARAGCVHSVAVDYVAGISATDYDRALRLLDQQFYVRRLGLSELPR